MSVAIAIFVKTPGLTPLKTRLAASIGPQRAEEFYSLSLKAIETTLQATQTTAYWAVTEKEGLDNPLWQNFTRLYSGGEKNLGACQYYIYETLLKTHEKVILIGADAPQISPEIITQATDALDRHDFTIGPARDGGYYLFGGRLSTTPNIWKNVSWSASTTRIELENALPSDAVHLDFLTDIDEEENLTALANEMPTSMNETQKNLLKWIEKL